MKAAEFTVIASGALLVVALAFRLVVWLSTGHDDVALGQVVITLLTAFVAALTAVRAGRALNGGGK